MLFYVYVSKEASCHFNNNNNNNNNNIQYLYSAL